MSFGNFEHVLDLVAVKPNLVKVFNAKVHLNDRLFEQCLACRAQCQEIYAVTRMPKRPGRTHTRVRTWMEQLEIGLYFVNDQGTLHRQMASQFWDCGAQLIRDACTRAQRSQAPGIPSPRRIRPDRWDPVRALVAEHDGELTAKDITRTLKLPVRERLELLKLARRGELRGLRVEGPEPVKFHVQEDAEWRP